MAKEFYNPIKSEKTHMGAITTFISDDIDEDLKTVPGIGSVFVGLLKEQGVTSTISLIGKFLSLHEHGMTALEHCVSWKCLPASHTPILDPRS